MNYSVAIVVGFGVALAPCGRVVAQGRGAAATLLTSADVERATGLKGTYSEPRPLACCEEFTLFTADSVSFVSGKFMESATYETLKQVQSGATPVPGVGDDAFYDPTLLVLTFRKASRAVSLQVVPNPTGPEVTQAQLIALAKTMALRLPR